MQGCLILIVVKIYPADYEEKLFMMSAIMTYYMHSICKLQGMQVRFFIPSLVKINGVVLGKKLDFHDVGLKICHSCVWICSLLPKAAPFIIWAQLFKALLA